MTDPSTPLICFDIGGVLVRICRDWTEGCRAARVETRPFAVDDDVHAARHELVGRLQRGEIEGPRFHADLSEILGGTWTAEEIARIDEAWLIDAYPGTAALVHELHRRGLETACLSNTSHDHWEVLQEYEAVRSLGRRHASHLMGLVKPDPAIYEAFERAVGRPAEAIVFFDDLEANIDAASDRGWRAHRIDHAGDPAEQMRRVLGELGLL